MLLAGITMALALGAGAALWAVLILAAVAVLHDIAGREAGAPEGPDDDPWPEPPGGLGRRAKARWDTPPEPAREGRPARSGPRLGEG